MALTGSFDDSVAAWRGRQPGLYFVQGPWTGFVSHMSTSALTGDPKSHVFQLRITTSGSVDKRYALYGQGSFSSDWAAV